MSLPVIGYFPNSDNNLAPLGAKVTALGGTAQGQNHSQKSLKRAAFKTHVSSLHSLMHDFFFFLRCWRKDSYFLEGGPVKVAGLTFGKMPIVNKQTESSWRFTKQEVGRAHILPS